MQDHRVNECKEPERVFFEHKLKNVNDIMIVFTTNERNFGKNYSLLCRAINSIYVAFSILFFFVK